MKLSEILVNGLLPEGFNTKEHALVFSTEIKNLIENAQNNTNQHKIQPIATIDGRWLSCADVLTEATQGIFSYIFSQIPLTTAQQVDIVLWSEGVSLLPQPEHFSNN